MLAAAETESTSMICWERPKGEEPPNGPQTPLRKEGEV
jgi:hypothetical protein